MEIKIFENAEFGSVRTANINGIPYFIGKDVCEMFGDKNHNRSLGRIDSEDKTKVDLIDNLGRKQSVIAVNESGLYALLFAMQPQKANNDGVSDAYPIEVQERIEKLHKFKRWVTSEVLPSIRKHGAYMTEQTLEKALASPDFLIQLANQIKAEKEKNRQLETQIAINNQIISELQPKADYTDRILQNKGLVTITQIAKDYGTTGAKMNELLHQLKVQFKQSGQWLLYAKYQNMGYTHSETIDFYHSDGRPDVQMNTKWTQKGRLFLYELLKKNGIVPVIEQ